MVSETLEDRRAWLGGELVGELSIAAQAIGIGEAALAAALSDGQSIAQVARRNGVKPHRVVTALVSRVVADVAADIRRGDLTADHVRWLVALATWRAEDQVASTFPPIEFSAGFYSASAPTSCSPTSGGAADQPQREAVKTADHVAYATRQDLVR